MTIGMLRFQQFIFKWSEKRKQSQVHTQQAKIPLCLSGCSLSTPPRKLMSCEAPDWIDARADAK